MSTPDNNGSLNATLQQAIAHHQAGRLQEAEYLYRAILRVQPEHPDANHNLGALAMQVKQPALGLPHFKAALDANPNQVQYWLSYSKALIQAGQPAFAREVLAQARQHGVQGEALEKLIGVLAVDESLAGQAKRPAMSTVLPDRWKSPGVKTKKMPKQSGRIRESRKGLRAPSSQEMNALATLFNQRRYLEGERLARTLIERFPLHGFGWMVLGNVLKQQGRFAEALAPMQKASELLPGDADVHYSLGGIFKEQGLFAEVEPCYRRALALRPDFAIAHCALGVILKELGRLAEAEICYRRALELRPDFVEAHTNLGVALLEQGRFSEAEASLHQALGLRPDFVEAHINLGVALLKQDRWPEAEASLRRALELSPNFVEAHINLSVTLLEQGKLTEARTSCVRALELQPDSASAHYNLGNVFRDLTNLDQAVLAYERAILHQPDMVEAYQALGDVFRFMDRKDGEVFAYQKALAIDPMKVGRETAVWLAVRYYLEGDAVQANNMLIASQSIMTTTDARCKPARIYWRYLSLLLSLPHQPTGDGPRLKDMAVLHVIGESHALSVHGVVVRYRQRERRCAAQWIAGCKQWHLGNSSRNKYKHKFESIMALLPRQSAVLLTIGEIDCRYDGGITKAWHKSPYKSLDDVAYATAEAYVRYIAEVGGRYGHRLVVCGVPAINFALEELTPEAAAQLVRLIRIFNMMLKDLALAAGMDFLDVYAFTNRGDGRATGQWHIDNFHLQPAAIIDVFDRYCLRGKGNAKA